MDGRARRHNEHASRQQGAAYKERFEQREPEAEDGGETDREPNEEAGDRHAVGPQRPCGECRAPERDERAGRLELGELHRADRLQREGGERRTGDHEPHGRDGLRRASHPPFSRYRHRQRRSGVAS